MYLLLYICTLSYIHFYVTYHNKNGVGGIRGLSLTYVIKLNSAESQLEHL